MVHYISKRDVVGTWDGLFSDTEIEKIVEVGTALETAKGVVGTPGDQLDPAPEVRSSDVSFIYRDENTEWIFERYDGAVNRLNSLLFNVDVEPLKVLQFTTYRGPGDHYTWHWDMRCVPQANSTEVVQQRKISIVTQLSDPEDYEGGVLKLAPCGNIFDVERSKGNTSVFLSFVNHQVTPVTSGVRYSLVGWCEGPDWR